MKHNTSILYVPAWQASGFFDDQQTITDGNYNRFVLSSICKEIAVRRCWQGLCNSVSITIANNGQHASVAWKYIKWSLLMLQRRQIDRIQKHINSFLDQWLGDKNVVLVNFQSINEFSVFVSEWARLRGIPTIVTEHLVRYPERETVLKSKKLDVYGNAECVCCVSNYVLRQLLVTNVPVRKHFIIGNYVMDKFVKEPKPQKMDKRILFVAGHPYDKDIPTLLRTAELLKGTGWEIDWYGCDEDMLLLNGERVGDAIGAMDVGEVLHVKGRLTHENLLKECAAYTLVLSTSYSETFGLGVAEAMLNGVPALCTDSGGIREFANEANSVIVRIGDTNALVDAITKVEWDHFDSEKISNEIKIKYGKERYEQQIFKLFSDIAKK